MFSIWNRKGQNTAEYAVLIGLVVGAAIGVQTYVKRGFQARVKTETDNYSNLVQTMTADSEYTQDFTGHDQWEYDQVDSRTTQQILGGRGHTVGAAGDSFKRLSTCVTLALEILSWCARSAGEAYLPSSRALRHSLAR